MNKKLYSLPTHSSKGFLLGEPRLLLAVLLIVVVAGTVVFGNVAPSGFTPASGNQGSPKTDKRAPDLDVGHSPKYPAISVTLTASASDNKKDDTGLKEVKIYLDDVLSKTCATSPCTYTVSNPKEGKHTYYATALDNAGNSKRRPGGTSTHKFTVDLTAPKVSVVAGKVLNSPTFVNGIWVNTSAFDTVSLGKVTSYLRNASNNRVFSKTCDFSGQKNGRCDFFWILDSNDPDSKGTYGYWGDAYDSAVNYVRDPANGEKQIVWP